MRTDSPTKDGTVGISGFEGINNRLDPVALTPKWQTAATGVLLDDVRHFVSQPVAIPALAGVEDAFSTRDGRMYAVVAGRLLRLDLDGVAVDLGPMPGAPFAWAELGYAVFALSLAGPEDWALYPDRLVPWSVPTPAAPPAVYPVAGRMPAGRYLVAAVLEAADGRLGGASPLAAVTLAATGGLRADLAPPAGFEARIYVTGPDGEVPRFAGHAPLDVTDIALGGPELPARTFPPPRGRLVCSVGNRMVVAVAEPDLDRSVLYWSEPDAPHRFDLLEHQLVAGTVTLLADVGGSLLVATDRAIVLAPTGGPAQPVADYGAPEGEVARAPDGRALFWTDRGLCAAPPFEILTEDRLSPTARRRASCARLRYRGSEYIIASLSAPRSTEEVSTWP